MPYIQVDQQGNICCTTSNLVTSQLPEGMIQIETETWVDGITNRYDLDSQQLVALPPVIPTQPTLSDLQQQLNLIQQQINTLTQG